MFFLQWPSWFVIVLNKVNQWAYLFFKWWKSNKINPICTYTSIRSGWRTLGTAVCTANSWLCVPNNAICPSLSTIASPSLNLLAKFTSPIKCSDRRPRARSMVVKSLSVQCNWRHSFSALIPRCRPGNRMKVKIRCIILVLGHFNFSSGTRENRLMATG